MDRGICHQTEKRSNDKSFNIVETSYSFSPTLYIIGSSLTVSGDNGNFIWSAGISDSIRFFSPNIIANNISYDKAIKHTFGENTKVFEPAAYFSSAWNISEKLLLDAGLRISSAFTGNAGFVIPEPRIRLSYNLNGTLSPHINYVRLSQLITR
jgi:hypothetical protein